MKEIKGFSEKYSIDSSTKMKYESSQRNFLSSGYKFNKKQICTLKEEE